MRNLKIASKLTTAFVAISLLTIAVFGVVGLSITQSVVEERAFQQLKSVRQVKTNQINGFFERAYNDTVILDGIMGSIRTEAFGKLEAIRQTKKGAVETYFDVALSQTSTFASNLMTQEALVAFATAFPSARTDFAMFGSEAPVSDAVLGAFYSEDFASAYASVNAGASVDMSGAFAALDKDARFLQGRYIYSNPNDFGSKHLMDAPEGTSTRYDVVHAKYHPKLRAYLEEFGYYDILLVDNASGRIVYSVFKELDFATSLLDGPWADTNIAEAFRAARDLPEGETTIVDYETYRPSYDAPASFVATPIYKDGQSVGTLIVQLPLDKITQVMSDRSGLGVTGQSYLVGQDNLLRSDTHLDPLEYSVAMSFKSPDTVRIDTASVSSALDGVTGTAVGLNYRGDNVVSAFAPVQIGGLNWSLVSEINISEAFAPGSGSKSKDFFSQFIEAREYYDLFLIDPSGYVFYSVARESDYQTNVITGEYRDSGLGTVMRAAMDTKAFAFADFAPYAPSNGDPAAFIAAPVLGPDGSADFIVALQLSIDAINRVMLEREGLGATGETYLVGQDNIMRSDSHRDPENHSVINSFRNPATGMVDTAASKAALSGETGAEIVMDYNGNPVLSAYAPLDVFGARWAIIAEIEEAEAFAAIRDVTKIVIGVAIATAVLASIVGIILSRTISRPVLAMTNAMRALADGNVHVDIPATDRGDEIGQMAQSVQVFKDNALQKLALEAEQADLHAQQEEQDREKRMREEEEARLEQERRDALAKAAREKAITEEIAKVVRACANGDFSQRLDTADKEGIFAELCDGINQIGDVADGGLKEVQKALSALSDGDLTYRMQGTFHGVFNDIRESVNQTSASLQGIVRTIQQNSLSVNAGSNEIATATEELASRTATNARDLETASAAIEQLSATVKSVAESANTASVSAQQIEAKASEGNKIVSTAVDAMQRIHMSSKEIAPITKLIDEISFQTNLLALNASVEAARAGAAGRGFAVVAGEVQNLAARSAKAAKDISALIEQSSKDIASGVVLVEKSGKSLDEISAGIVEVTAMISSVAKATREQSASVDDLSRTASALDHTMQENSAMVEETATVTQNLRADAEGLTRVVSRFQFDGQPPRGMTLNTSGRTASSPSPKRAVNGIH